ncbi:unnamed protein product [Phytomonas sp. EM1]|nr:unnamed protein product [Phytomonas sp. EM1]|eukprot:CCW64269.1 unnamed protein product [Phytomonas sp. isolate EM1]
MSSDCQDVSLASSVNHAEDEPSMAESSSGLAGRMPRVISAVSSVSKEFLHDDIVPSGVGSKDITISYIVSAGDAQTIGDSLHPVTSAIVPASLSLRRAGDTNSTERCYPLNVTQHSVRTLSNSVALNAMNPPQLLGIGAIFSNSVHPQTGDARSFAKPTLAPSSVRWCSPDQWVPDAQVVNCMAPDCKMPFSLFTRKEHCKICGRVFCSSCCSNEVEILEDRSPCLSHSCNASGNVKGLDLLASNGFHHPRSHSFMANETDSTPVTGSPSHPNRSASAGFINIATGHTAISNTDVISTNVVPGSSCAASADNASSIGTPLPQTSKGVVYRVCNECFYETQLVVSTRGEDSKPRRKCRGQLKMFQRALLVNVLSFLSLRDLLEIALVSSDFYFMSRDNVIWYQYNTARWLKETENPYFSFTGDTNHMLTVAAANSALSSGGLRHWFSAHESYYKSTSSPSALSTLTIALDGSNASVGEGSIKFPRAPFLEDATVLTQGEAFKRVISHHARYNYTQFLDFARRQEMARCEGLAWFSVAARVLFSSPIRVALIGPPGVGKTTSLLAFLRKNKRGSTVHSTMGFTRHRVTLWIRGESKVGVNLEIYDVSGDERYESLRRFICSHCHAIGLCYNPCRKVTLVQAADVMMGVEPALGPQPVVVCGLIPSTESDVADASNIPPKDVSNGLNGVRPDLQVPQASHQQHPYTLPAVSFATLATPSSEVSARSQGSTVASTITVREATSPPLASTHPAHGSMVWGAEGAPSSRTQGLTPPRHSSLIEVSEEDAAGITVRDGGSLHCPIDQTHVFYDRLLGSLIDRLSLAVMANRTSIANLTDVTEESESNKFGGVSASNCSRSFAKRDPKVDKDIAEELLKLTMQPSTLNILLDR